MQLTHYLSKARSLLPPTNTSNLNTIGQAFPEIQERGVHVRTCRGTPPMHWLVMILHPLMPSGLAAGLS